MVMLAGRAETPRSARLPQPTAAVVVAMALALPQRLSAGVAEVSVQRGRQQAPWEPTVVVVVVVVALLLVSVP